MFGNNLVSKLDGIIREYVRVLKVTKKPTGEEFKTVVKISGLGMIVIGMMGFLLQMLRYYLIK